MLLYGRVLYKVMITSVFQISEEYSDEIFFALFSLDLLLY